MQVTTKKVLALLFAVFALSWATQVSAQDILAAGELIIDVTNPWESTWITVEAVSVVWGKWQNGYPVRTDLGYYRDYTYHYCFDHIGSDDLGLDIVGYGRYKITIDGYSTYVDYRDCDYQGEDWPLGYFSADIHVTYNKTTHAFTREPSTGNIWNNRYHPEDKDITQFKIPVTATNDFSGGQITMDGTNYNTPKTLNWPWTSSKTIAVISPQTVTGMIYTFSQWSDGVCTQSRNVYIDDQHNSYSFTAEFTYKPIPPQNFSLGYDNGHPKLTWDENPNASVSGYWIYRNYNNEGWERVKTITPRTTTECVDEDIQCTTPPLRLVKYKARTFIDENNYSDYSNEESCWGRIILNKPGQTASSEAPKPLAFSLDDNYPNPFNPETTIRYQLAEGSRVRMSVYNVLGAEVQRLVDENQPAGVYSIRWDGRDTYGKQISGGIYIYKIEAVGSLGRFVQTRKMSLIK